MNGTSAELEIKRFLEGRSNGGRLFEALYGAVADEPIPPRLLEILRGSNPLEPGTSTESRAAA